MLNGEVRRTVTQSGPWYGGGDNDNITLLIRNFLQLMQLRALSGLSPEGGERDIFRDIRNTNRTGKQEDAVARACRRPPEIQREVCLGRRNGRNAMDYCVSETASMFQMIRSYAAALHRNTMTPRLQATPDAGKPWSLSPGATGGHRCPDTLVSILDLRHLSPDKDSTASPNRRTPSAPHSREPLDVISVDFVSDFRTQWTRCHHECGRFRGETSSLHSY